MATTRGFSIFSKNTPPAELSTSSAANETSDKSAYLAAGKFPYDTLMGDWTIIGSSLALWKNRSDVLCRYTPHTLPRADAEAGQLDFSDEIWYEQLDEAGTHLPGKGARREVQSMIRGRNRLDTSGANHASFFWRGYWLLKPFTSRWQVLAFSDNFLDEQAQEQSSEPVWIVTYFTATWFTDAGIDLYARGNVSEAQYDTILEALRTHPGDDEASKELRSLAEQMFRIPTGNV